MLACRIEQKTYVYNEKRDMRERERERASERERESGINNLQELKKLSISLNNLSS